MGVRPEVLVDSPLHSWSWGRACKRVSLGGAGSERSIPILMEISATLKQIDGRLANIEQLLQEDAKKK